MILPNKVEPIKPNYHEEQDHIAMEKAKENK